MSHSQNVNLRFGIGFGDGSKYREAGQTFPVFQNLKFWKSLNNRIIIDMGEKKQMLKEWAALKRRIPGQVWAILKFSDWSRPVAAGADSAGNLRFRSGVSGALFKRRRSLKMTTTS
jgi:hypothetical protein